MSGIEKFSIKITDPEELQIAKDYRDALSTLQDEGTALAVRHDQETKNFLARHKKINRDFFTRLTEKHVPDPHEAFRTGEWYCDISYVHLHGEAYIVHNLKQNAPTEDDEETPTVEGAVIKRFDIN